MFDYDFFLKLEKMNGFHEIDIEKIILETHQKFMRHSTYISDGIKPHK